ncbi:hypothetical protein AAF712_008795 [Marasmius tenuissimus]|uniref:SGNH hydrolase-type esterase domain-containing protein n=1 Tax=Marasmius tenuissimus TaxID=585030 RepID=A0ABR2ZRB5_9AGAR
MPLRNSDILSSFYASSSWKTARLRSTQLVYSAAAEIAKGRRTLVTIQFGHNDRWVGTPDAMAQRLTAMVQQVKQIKAEPVLITSLIVRDFDTAGKKIIDDTLLPYAAATIQVSINEKTHLLDLHAQSLKYSEAIGTTASQKLDPPGDTTHLNSNGAVVFGRMVADLMNADFGLIGINLLPIISNSELSYNISHGIPSY